VCARAGITPNHITWAALGLGIGAGVALGFGLLGLGGLLSLLSVLGDILDGQVARLTATGSAAGEILDASADRYMEFFYVGGLVIFYRGHPLFMLVALGAMLAAFMVSYSTAKAEAMHVEPPRGAMRRHERSTYLISGAVLSSIFSHWLEPFRPLPELQAPLMFGALAIVAVAGNVSAVRRLALTARALRARDQVHQVQKRDA
jgi:CDP-diacylglycerol--glycerol-3-phosphate 3-phosphatidyltransferase